MAPADAVDSPLSPRSPEELLHAAALADDYDAACLHAMDADVHAVDADGNTALHVAARHSSAVVSLLLLCGGVQALGAQRAQCGAEYAAAPERAGGPGGKLQAPGLRRRIGVPRRGARAPGGKLCSQTRAHPHR